MSKLNYVELPAPDVPAVRDFYAEAFGWRFTDYGPGYAASERETTLGLNGGEGEEGIAAILPLVEAEDLEAALARVIGAGGEIVVPIVGYPGGRRFHFRDPAGNVLGVYASTPEGA